MDSTRHSCLRLELAAEKSSTDAIFIKGTWFESHFSLSISDGLDAWVCNASEDEVQERADQWDQSVSEYIDTAEQYLGFQQPGSNYSFLDAGNGFKRFSWTFEKQGIKLEWRWKCKSSSNKKKTTAEIMDFLMDANIRLSEEVVRKRQACERLKAEAEKCLAQSEKLSTEKQEIETALYAKFVAVLNSKKAKLRELRDQQGVSKQQQQQQKKDVSSTTSNKKGKSPQVEVKEEEEEEEEEEDNVSTDKTESYDEEEEEQQSDHNKTEEDEEVADSHPATSSSSSRGRKRKMHK